VFQKKFSPAHLYLIKATHGRPEIIYDALFGSFLSPLLLPEVLDLRAYLHEIEAGFIRQAMEETSGAVSHAAARLGLRRTTLLEKLRKFGMSSAVTNEHDGMIDQHADAAARQKG
jgi:transcriptional regulator of acetoin/glycerol metabolism